MRCFSIGLDEMIKVTLLHEEHLIPPKKHTARQTTEYILYAITDGELWLNHNHKARRLVPGDILIMKKGEYQFPTKASDCSYLFLHFETDRLEEHDLSDLEYLEKINQTKKDFYAQKLYTASCYDYIKVHLWEHIHIEDESKFQYIISLLNNHRLAYETDSPIARLKRSAAISEMFLLLESMVIRQLQAKMGNQKKGDLAVDKIAEYIRKNYTQNIDSTQIEQLFFINYDYANRLFKKEFGCTILQYRNSVRISFAKEQIRMFNDSFYEISMAVGFHDVGYFSKVFKQLEGISPKGYRELLRKEQQG